MGELTKAELEACYEWAARRILELEAEVKRLEERALDEYDQGYRDASETAHEFD